MQNGIESGYPTVDSHVEYVYLKLKAHNAPSAVNMAHRFGFFPSDA